MSLKPFKKSDLEKGWMKKRRDRKIRIQPEYHLIVTEGTKVYELIEILKPYLVENIAFRMEG